MNPRLRLVMIFLLVAVLLLFVAIYTRRRRPQPGRQERELKMTRLGFTAWFSLAMRWKTKP